MHDELKLEALAVTGKLTDSMRLALLNAGSLRHGWTDQHLHWDLPGGVVGALRRRGLAKNIGRQLTPLGLAVKSILQEHPNG